MVISGHATIRVSFGYELVTSGARVQIGSSHSECRFECGSGSFSSCFRSGVCYKHTYVLFLGFLGLEVTQVKNINGVVMHISG